MIWYMIFVDIYIFTLYICIDDRFGDWDVDSAKNLYIMLGIDVGSPLNMDVKFFEFWLK